MFRAANLKQPAKKNVRLPLVGASEPFTKKMTTKVNPVSIVCFFPALYDPWVFSTLLGKDFLLLAK